MKITLEGFMLNRIKNESRRITFGCATQGCPWRVHGSPTYDRVTFMLKTLRNEHTCLAVTKNRDVRAPWLGKKFQGVIQENPGMSIRILHSIVLRTCGLDVPDHTLYRAKNYALCIEEKEHIRSYNMLYRYAEVIHERNPGSCVKINTININPDPKIPAHFQRLFLSFHAQKLGYLEGCRPFIGLDGCHLKGPFEGILLCALALDANNGKKRAGRPKKQRIRGATESRRVQRSIGFRCSKCKEVGHNSRTCQNRDHTSTVPSNTNQPQKSRRMEVGSSSAGAATNSQASPPSSQMMPPNTGTVTRVLWFPSTQQESSNQPFDPVGSQPLTPNAPQCSQQLPGNILLFLYC
ncbi:hypothetical protein ACOSP7_032945 [Xanthoceras sorbifolium]